MKFKKILYSFAKKGDIFAINRVVRFRYNVVKSWWAFFMDPSTMGESPIIYLGTFFFIVVLFIILLSCECNRLSGISLSVTVSLSLQQHRRTLRVVDKFLRLFDYLNSARFQVGGGTQTKTHSLVIRTNTLVCNWKIAFQKPPRVVVLRQFKWHLF